MIPAAPDLSASPAVAAAIVSWNTRELLDRCLESLRPDAEAGLVAVTVVDNGSSDGSRKMVVERHPWVRLIASEENLGFGAGVNRGLDGARSPWLLAANADVEFEHGALRALVAAGDEEPAAGIVAPRLLWPDGRQQKVFAFPGVGRAALEMAGGRRLPWRGLREWIEYGRRWDPAATQWIDWAMGAVLLIRRRAYADVEGFDPGQWMYAEDLDLAWRMREEGWRSRYAGSARVRHAAGSASGQAFDPDEGRLLVSAAYFDWVRRRLGRARFAAIFAIVQAGCLARFGALRLAGRAGSAARWRARARTDREAARRVAAGWTRP